MELVEVVAADGATRAEVAAPRRRRRGRERASDRAGDRARARARELGELPAVDGFRNRAGRRRRGVVEGHEVEVGRARRTRSRSRWDGRAARAGSSCRDTRQADRAPRRSRELRALGLTPVLLTGDNERDGASGSPPRSASSACSPRCSRTDKVAEVARLQAGGRGRGDGRRRRQRRPRARAGRPRPRDRHRHRRRDRGERPHARLRRPARRRRRDPPRPPHARARSRATSSGRSPTTSPRSRSRSPGSSNPIVAAAAMALLERVRRHATRLRLRRFRSLRHGTRATAIAK